MTPNWTWTLNSQNYSIYNEYLPQKPKFWRVSLYDKLLPRNKVKNGKSSEWPQIELVHFAVKNIKYTLNTYPTGPSCGPFRSPKQWQVLCMHERFSSEAKILVLFALRPLFFKTQGRRKSEMHRMTPTELEHLTVKSTLYTLNTCPCIAWGLNFGPFWNLNCRGFVCMVLYVLWVLEIVSTLAIRIFHVVIQ